MPTTSASCRSAPTQRDEKAIERWRRDVWPDLVWQAKGERRMLVFADEAGFYLLSGTVRTDAPIGQTPVIRVRQSRDLISVMGGMMIAIPEDEWVVFHDLNPGELAGVLVQLARAVRLPKSQKHPRGPKKLQPKKRSGAKIKHVSNAKLLADNKKCTI